MHIYIYIYIYIQYHVSYHIYVCHVVCGTHVYSTTVNIFMQSYSHSLLTCTMVLSEVATFYRWYILQHI
jgi:hypothetical protein